MILLIILKVNGILEKLLVLSGVKISWYEFVSGLLLLEVFNVGGVDLSVDVVDIVFVFV